jgi:hypothetical protein
MPAFSALMQSGLSERCPGSSWHHALIAGSTSGWAVYHETVRFASGGEPAGSGCASADNVTAPARVAIIIAFIPCALPRILARPGRSVAHTLRHEAANQSTSPVAGPRRRPSFARAARLGALSHLLELMRRQDVLLPFRRRVIGAAEGRVLEVGIGSAAVMARGVSNRNGSDEPCARQRGSRRPTATPRTGGPRHGAGTLGRDVPGSLAGRDGEQHADEG